MHKTKGDGNLNGQFRDTSSQTGTQGTVVDADWLNTVQNELVNLLEDNNVTLDDTDNSQIATLLHNVLRGIFNQVGMSKNDAGASDTAIVNIIDGLGMLLNNPEPGNADSMTTNFSAYGVRINHLTNSNIRWTCEIHRDHIVFQKKRHSGSQEESQEDVLRSIVIDMADLTKGIYITEANGYSIDIKSEGIVIKNVIQNVTYVVGRLDNTGFATIGHADVSNGEVICKGIRCVQSTILDKWTSFLKTSSDLNLAKSLSSTTSDEGQFEAGHRIVVFNESGDHSIAVTLNATGVSETLGGGCAAEFICLGVDNHDALFVKL